jgi:hypothetical protein
MRQHGFNWCFQQQTSAEAIPVRHEWRKDGCFHPAGKGISVFLTPVQGRALRVWGKKSSSLRCGIFTPKTLHRLNTNLFLPAGWKHPSFIINN